VVLIDGQRLDAWGLAAKVVHLPGHTPGSIGILTDDGALVAGDACVNRKTPGPSPFVQSFDDYRGSVEKLRGMAGTAARVYPGHGSPFEGKELEKLAI